VFYVMRVFFVTSPMEPFTKGTAASGRFTEGPRAKHA